MKLFDEKLYYNVDKPLQRVCTKERKETV